MNPVHYARPLPPSAARAGSAPPASSPAPAAPPRPVQATAAAAPVVQRRGSARATRAMPARRAPRCARRTAGTRRPVYRLRDVSRVLCVLGGVARVPCMRSSVHVCVKHAQTPSPALHCVFMSVGMVFAAETDEPLNHCVRWGIVFDTIVVIIRQRNSPQPARILCE